MVFIGDEEVKGGFVKVKCMYRKEEEKVEAG
jgi:histidyl-tRNA synthetase